MTRTAGRRRAFPAALPKCPPGARVGRDHKGRLAERQTDVRLRQRRLGQDLAGMAFLVRVIMHHDEPGVFMQLPLPERRLIGDMRDKKRICQGLNL